MKHLLLAVTVLMTCVILQAQPEAGQLFVGGNIGIYSSSEKFKDAGTITYERSNTLIDILPKAGYFLSGRLAAGVQTGISSSVSKFPNADPDKRSSVMFIIAPFGRYYLLSGTGGIFAEASLEFAAGKRKTFNEAGTVETNLSSMSAGISPGVYYYLTPEISLEAKFGWLGFTSETEKDGDQKYIQNDGGLNLNLTGFSFGVMFVM